jgi:predicted NAD/FAD-binding protein
MSGVQIISGQPVQRIIRDGKSVTIISSQSEVFDAVVIATHADEALSLLENTSFAEQEILGLFSYAKNTAVLHNDTSFMPLNRRAWASWNYYSAQENGVSDISLTYNMNSLQHIPVDFPTFVTLNPHREISKKHLFESFTYSHPILNASAREAQKRLPEIQGKNNIYFAGAHWGNGFHEDGVVSAIEAVKALNFPIRITV